MVQGMPARSISERGVEGLFVRIDYGIYMRDIKRKPMMMVLRNIASYDIIHTAVLQYCCSRPDLEGERLIM